MTTPLPALPLPLPVPGPVKRKRVLLVDAAAAKRELRAEALRNRGIDVDCACDIGEARAWWRADLYSLVLVNPEHDLSHWDDFCTDLRVATPPQKLAFLVGKPAYLADSPNLPLAMQPEHGSIELAEDAETLEPVAPSGVRALRWGIMEASRRISAVRSASATRSTAIRNRPTPPRDLEPNPSRHDEVASRIAAALRKEELL